MKTIKHTYPGPLQEFIDALLENARVVWPNDEDKAFINSIPYVTTNNDGVWQVSDNYDGRTFGAVYLYDAISDTWEIGRLYSESPPKPYTFRQALADAGIMFTG